MRKKTKGDRSDNGQLMQMVQLCENEKEMQFLIGGDPMVRFIKRKDLPRYVKEGYNIPYIGHLYSIDDVKEAIKFASSISATRGVTLLMMDNSLVTSARPTRLSTAKSPLKAKPKRFPSTFQSRATIPTRSPKLLRLSD